MEVKFKRLVSEAVLPSYAKPGDAGLDLFATSVTRKELYIEYGTGLAVEIPRKYVGLVFPRSSISDFSISLANSVGVIDSGYRGEIKLRFKITTETEIRYHQLDSPRDINDKLFIIGEKIGQLLIIPFPNIKPILSNKLSKTERGEGGFGHTTVNEIHIIK